MSLKKAGLKRAELKPGEWKRAENEAIKWLAKLNASNLAPADEADFFDWLNASPLHQAAYIKAEELWQRGEALQKVSTASSAPRWTLPLPWQGWAVACACLLVVGLVLLPQFNKKNSLHTYQTAIGEQREIHLEDGSKITLNTDTRLDMQFNAGERSATLVQGEVFFDVAPDQHRPFDVVTDVGLVRVLGTRFAVHKLKADAVVTVVEGRVALGNKPGGDHEFMPALTLHANERSSLDAARAGKSAEALDAGAALSWRNHQLIYRDARLADVITDLNRYFPEPIHLDDQMLGERQITAVIQLADLASTLRALGQSLNLRVEPAPTGSGMVLRQEPSKSPH